MTNIIRSRLLAGSAAAVLIALAACNNTPKQHAADGDTGAAAPATVRDMSATPKAGDSTAGVTPPTGSSAPAGTTDTTKKMPAASRRP